MTKPNWIKVATMDNINEPMVEPPMIGAAVDINLKACHEMLDRAGVPRFGSLRPYDYKLWQRVLWLVTECRIELPARGK